MHPKKLFASGLLLLATPILLVSAGNAQELGEVENAASSNEVELAQAVHFDTTAGQFLRLEPGRYLVLPAGEGELDLVPIIGDEEAARVSHEQTVSLRAAVTSHDEDVLTPQALSIEGEKDAHHVVLVMPDGKALDAAGSITGVRERGLTRAKVSSARISTSRARYTSQSLRAYNIAKIKTQPKREPKCPDFVTVQIPDERNVTLWTLAEGDAEIGGTGTDGKLDIYTWLHHTPMRLWLRGSVSAEELENDRTRFEGAFTKIFFDARQHGNCEIARVEVRTYTRGTIQHHGSLSVRKDRGKSGVFPGRDGIVRQADCRFNSKGKDTGKLGCSRISFHPVKVYLKKVREDCGTTRVSLPVSKFVFPLQHIASDDEVAGNDRNIYLRSSVDGWGGPTAQVLSGGRVHVSGAVVIREIQGVMTGNRSVFGSPFAFDIFGQPDAPDHCRAQRVVSPSFDSTFVRGVRNHNWTYYQARGIVDSMYCRSDTSGKDGPRVGGGIGCDLNFRAVTLQMTNR